MPTKPSHQPKLTDAERHKRFVEMAHEVEANEKPKDFDDAFKSVVRPHPHEPKHRNRREED